MYRAQLDEYVQAALDKWPTLTYKNGGSRAHAAADLVSEGRIQSLAVMASGFDYWGCDSYTISIRGKSCSCLDNMAPEHDGGKLCKHRLAAMFIVKLQQRSHSELDKLLADAPGDEIVLKVSAIFKEKGRAYAVAGHRYQGHQWIDYSQTHRFDVTEGQFERTLQRHGWRINGRPVKQPGLTYNYFLARVGTDAETEPEYTLGASDIARAEREQQEKRFKEIEIGQELVAELVNG